MMGMNDYIMNRESLKRHCEAMCKRFKDAPTSGTYSEHRLVLDLLEQTRWIPCSEKMPPITQRVLVSATNGEVLIARYHSFDKWTFEPTGVSYAYNKDSIVAWMPLPQPYTESEDKE